MIFVIAQGDIELVSDLLIGGADVEQISYASITALHLASLEGHAQVGSFHKSRYLLY